MPPTQKVFCLGRPLESVTWEDMVPVMQHEAAHIWSLYERGIARDAWIRTDALGAVYVLESTHEQATCLLSKHPVVTSGLVRFEVVPVGPFTPFSLLFGTQAQPVPAAVSNMPRAGNSQRVLAFYRPVDGVTAEDLGLHLADEARYAWSLWKAGLLRENYLRTDQPGAALVLEVNGVPDAHAVMAELPLVRLGLTEFDCLAVGAFTGYDALLEGALDD